MGSSAPSSTPRVTKKVTPYDTGNDSGGEVNQKGRGSNREQDAAETMKRLNRETDARRTQKPVPVQDGRKKK